MLVQYRHVIYSEKFWVIDNGANTAYIKKNHNRAVLVHEAKINVPTTKPIFRVFKKNYPVIVLWKKTAENAWMELPCQHEIVPFDNDKQCVHCGEEFKG